MKIARVVRQILFALAVCVVASSLAAEDGPLEFLVHDDTDGRQERAKVVRGAEGGFIVAWETPGAPRDIVARLYDSAGNAVSDEIRVNTSDGSNSYLNLDSNDNGFVVVWDWSLESGLEAVLARQFSLTGEPLGDEIQVHGRSGVSDVALDSQGDFVVVYPDVFSGILAQRYASNGTPQGDAFQVNTYPANSQGRPMITAGDSGFLITWIARDQDGDSDGVFARSFDASMEPLTDELQLNVNTAFRQRHAVVEWDPAGRYLVAWNDDRRGIDATFVDAQGGPGGGVFPVTGDRGEDPTIAFGADGEFLVVWNFHSRGEDTPYGRFFDGSGTAVNGEFQVSALENTYTTGPVVAGDGAGSFMVVFENESDRNRDVMARRLPVDRRSGGVRFEPDTFRPSSYPGLETDFAVVESSEAASISVFRTGGNQGEILFSLSSVDGTASPGVDFPTSFPTFRLTDGEIGPIRVPFALSDDTTVEGSETVLLGIEDVSGVGAEPGASALLTIIDDDFGSAGADGPENAVSVPGGRNSWPQVAVATSGEMMVVWGRSLAGDFGIHGRFYDQQSQPIGPAFRISDDSVIAVQPAVAVDDEGDFVVVWDQGSDDRALHGRSFTREGESLSGEFVVVPVFCPGSDSCRPIRANIAAQGENFAVTWAESPSGSFAQVYGQRVDKTGLLVGDRFYVAGGRAEATLPTVASDSAGNFTIAYTDRNRREIAAQFFDNAGVRRGDPLTIAEVSSASGPVIAYRKDLENPDLLFTWAGTPPEIEWLELEAGEPPGIVGQANTFTLNTQTRPDIVVDDNGGAVIVWESREESLLAQDGDGDGVFGQRFNPSGEPFGGEFRVNTITTGDQRRPQVAGDGSGDFVVVWESEETPGSTSVRMQRFSAADCTPGGSTLCLNDGRFRVTARWRDFDGNIGQGYAVPLTSDTGYFWFFDEDNVEVVLKALDGRGINDHFWVFYGALSNVEYTVTVTDTTTGETLTYENPLGEFASVGDTQAFPAAGAPRSAARSVALAIPPKTDCSANATTLCLNDGRFMVEMEWEDFDGGTGVGNSQDLTNDTGYFWFFGPENVEVVVKVLDARHLNDHFWVFYGGLTNVRWKMTVTDTETGFVREYNNALGQFASGGDVEAIPGE